MMGNKNYDANGQIVFIEPLWVTGETCLFNIKDPFKYSYAKSKLTKIRKEFIKKLENNGFTISYDRNNTAEDTVCFIMNGESISESDENIKEYKKEFDTRMFEAGGDKLYYPYTLRFEEFLEKPFFPAVLKNEMKNGGIDKFLIETKEQLEKIRKFYSTYSKNKRFIDSFSGSIFQQLIETPTNYQTYMRVLMSASGDVMGASLKYSNTYEKEREPIGIFEKYFWDKNSDFYLNCNGMFNYYSEGENIYFSQPKFSTIKKKILEQHGIDTNNPTVPIDVLEVTSNIMKKCNKELGIICGFDFILNKNDNKWYYLENQAFPAIEEWAVTKGIRRINVNSVDDYIKLCELELEARYESLIMYMNKKNEKDNTIKYELKLK